AECMLDITITSSDLSLISNGNITYTCNADTYTMMVTPATNASGIATISVLAVDDGALTSISSFMLTVTNINDIPVISSIADQTTDEDIAMNPVSFTVSDADNEPLTVTVISGDTSLVAMNSASITLSGYSGGMTYSYVTLSGGEPLTLTLLPLTNENGVLEITVTVSDDIVEVSEFFTLTVMPVNDAPAISSISDQTTSEDTPMSPITFTVSDVDSSNLSVVLYSDPWVIAQSAECITLENASGMTSYTGLSASSGESLTLILNPLSNESGSVNFTMTVSDGSLQVDEFFTLDVTPVNDAPEVSSISNATTNENTPIGFTFTASDPEMAECMLDITITSSDQSLISNGNITYTCNADTYTMMVTPATNASGIATISVLAVDDGALTSISSFMLTVTNINDAPVISSIADQTTNEDTAMNPVSFTVSDADNEPLTVVIQSGNTSLVALSADNITISNDSYGDTFTFTTVSGGESLSLSILPIVDMSGSVEITVTVSDEVNFSSTSFTLTVNAVNDAPVISDSTFSINENSATGYSLGTLSLSDVDSLELTVTIVSGNTNAAFAINNSGDLTVNNGNALDYETI
ncbi:MAG: hypothetical protein OMM_12481, partial [Candidatus Magnetoglobus multicellularis str. Araruama]